MQASPSDPIKVLLVDDHKSILWGLERLIESEQPKMKVVGKASTRAQALTTAREAQPDVILLDVDLNGDNSLDFLPDLLQLTHTRILILTGSRDLRLREQAMMQGACGIVLKEEQAEVIIKAIERVHEGELWLDRATTGRVFDQLANRGARDREAEKIASLTAKESKVVAAIVEHGGASNKEIAKQLYVSEYTLRNHLTSVYSKLELHNRLELFMYATEHRLGKRTISSH